MKFVFGPKLSTISNQLFMVDDDGAGHQKDDGFDGTGNHEKMMAPLEPVFSGWNQNPEPEKYFNQFPRRKSFETVIKVRNGRILKGFKYLFSLLIGCIILALSIVLFSRLNPILLNVFESHLKLEANTTISENWKTPQVSLVSRYFLFSLKNARQFVQGEHPVVEEVGPFVYKLTFNRSVLKWKRKTIKFNEIVNFEFDQGNSLPLETKLLVLNYPLLTALFMVRRMVPKENFLGFLNPMAQNLLSSVMNKNGEKIIERRSAYEMMHGRSVRFLVYLERLLAPLAVIGIKLPSLDHGSSWANFRYGFGPQLSGKEFGPVEHFLQSRTSEDPNHLFDGIYSINGMKHIKEFQPPCDRINGSSGSFFGLELNTPTIDFYNHIICRRIKLIRNRDYHHHEGISVIRYWMDENMFNMRIKENQCYCLARKLSGCQGWTSPTPCMGDVPMGVSFPHFYNSQNKQRAVSGLKPNRAQHLGFLDLEPHSGMPVNGRIPIQFNMRVRDLPIEGLQGLPKVLLPMFWVEQESNIGAPFLTWFMIGSALLSYGKYAVLLIGIIISMVWFKKTM